MPDSLIKLNLWWTGPFWLSFDRDQWPSISLPIHNEDIPERKTSKIKTFVTSITHSQDLDFFSRYSRFSTLIRIVTYILRFVNNARQPRKLSDESHIITVSQRCSIQPITRDEQNQTIMRLVKLILASYFAGKLKSLTKLGCVTRNNPILRLNPFIDDLGILRVGGRLKSSYLHNQTSNTTTRTSSILSPHYKT